MSSGLMAQMTVGGTAAAIGGDCYRLTAAANSQAGYVYQNAAINLKEPFNFKFSVYLGTNNGGADGIVFVLRPSLGTPYIGTGGGLLGYQGTGFTNSIGIEVDTWFNGGFGDIAADHIGIFKNGSINHNLGSSLAGPIQASSLSNNVEDGNYHTLNVRWDPDSTKLEVYFDCDYRLQYIGDLVDSVFQGDSLVHWGFLGTTGGANNLQQFCFTTSIDSLITELEDRSICQGDTVHLNAGSSTCEYTWSPSATLSSSTSNKPVATPSVTTTYYVTISHECDTIYDTATVTILEPTFTAAAALVEPLCQGDCDGSIDVTITGGSGGYAYLWSNTDTTEDITGVCADLYQVTLTDTVQSSTTYLCTKTFDWTIDEPDKLLAIPGATGNTSCPDGSTCDGSASVSAIGGIAPYQFLWTSGEIGTQAQSLCADSNWVSVTDDNGCEADTFVFIGIPDSIKTTGYGDTLICISNSAAIAAASTGGTPPYYYTWTEASLSGTVIANSAITNVYPGETTQYFVSSTDSKGCPGDTGEVLVRVRPELGLIKPRLDTICPYDTISFSVQATGGDSNYAYAWSSGDFGSSISISPNQSRWFVVTVQDVCGTPQIVDSVFQQVGGYGPINARIKTEDDSICAGESVYLIANGTGGFRGPDEYKYTWSHTESRNNIQFDAPLKTTDYYLTITDLCLSPAGYDTVKIRLNETEFPEILVNPSEACARSESEIFIANTQPGYSYKWAMGDGQVISLGRVDSTLRHIYDEVGCYDLSTEFITDFGCAAQIQFPCAVKVLEQPLANFSVAPEYPTNLNPILMFTNESERDSIFEWYYFDSPFGSDEQFEYEFSEAIDQYRIRLIATSKDGCTDTAQVLLPFITESVFYWPRSFTPNGDGLNDHFLIHGDFSGLQQFELAVYDRWGHQVFRSNNPYTPWDGSNPKGEIHTAGSYLMTLRYQMAGEELVVKRDQIVISKAGKEVGLR